MTCTIHNTEKKCKHHHVYLTLQRMRFMNTVIDNYVTKYNNKSILYCKTNKIGVEKFYHNHAPSQNAVSVSKCVANMKRKAATSEDAPGQIYSSHITELTAEEKASLPNSDTIKRTLRNQRSKMHPPVPASLHDLVIEGIWTETAGREQNPFMFFDNGPDADSRIIAFGTDESLRLLAESDTWMMDGNFAMAPQGFTQIYVIRVPLGDTAVSTVYACLQGKSQDVYETFLQAIMDHCQTLNAYPDPRTVIVRLREGRYSSHQCCFWTSNFYSRMLLPPYTEHVEENPGSWTFQCVQGERWVQAVLRRTGWSCFPPSGRLRSRYGIPGGQLPRCCCSSSRVFRSDVCVGDIYTKETSHSRGRSSSHQFQAHPSKIPTRTLEC